MKYLQTVFALYFSKVRLSFPIKFGASEAREVKGAFLPLFGIEDNVKLSISFVLMYSLCLCLKDDIFIYCVVEILGKL